ncbi:TPA: glycosyltransferase family 4 protein [Streptococcus suis]|nr:glycosyltransferase family 4 protein [Streptococcus suis]
MKKDILFLCQYFYPEYVTSALLPYQTAKELVDNNISVDVLCGYPKEYHSKNNSTVPKTEVADGITIKRVNYLQLNRRNALFRLINYFSFVFSCFLRFATLRNYKLIYVYSNPPILPLLTVLANMLFKTKFVFVAYDIYPDIAIKTNILSEKNPISLITNLISAQVFRRAEKIVALSKEMKEYLVTQKQVDEDKIQVIPNWATEKEREVLPKDNSSEEIIISYLGNMGIPQDFDRIEEIISNEVIRTLPIQFIFAGHGSRKDKLKEFVVSNKLSKVIVYDYLQEQDYDEILQKSDYHMLSLNSDLQGLAVPSKFYSYINNEKPVIALIHEGSDIAKDIQRYDLGYVIARGELMAAVEVFTKLVQSEKVHKVKQHKVHFSKEIQLGKYVNLTLEMLEKEKKV